MYVDYRNKNVSLGKRRKLISNLSLVKLAQLQMSTMQAVIAYEGSEPFIGQVLQELSFT